MKIKSILKNNIDNSYNIIFKKILIMYNIILMFPNNINTLNNMRNPSQFGINQLTSGHHNFSQAYQQYNQLIPQRPTNNDGNLAHNNVNSNLLAEMITGYTINVDSADRDLNNYPSPYNFAISLGGAGTSTCRVADRANQGFTVKTTFAGVPNPRIDMNFKNVKYIKLKYILMPKIMLYFTERLIPNPTNTIYTYTYNTSNDPEKPDLKTVNIINKALYYDATHINLNSTQTNMGFGNYYYIDNVNLFPQSNPPNAIVPLKPTINVSNYINSTINPLEIGLYTKTKQHILANYRYLLLRIKEIDNDKTLTSTNSNRDNCFILYRDSNYQDAKNDLWIATQPTKIFYDDNLKNLSKLSIEILTPDCSQFELKYYGDYNFNDITGNVKIDSPQPIPLSHITNKTAIYLNNNEGDLFDASNINIEFEIGVCENQINTEKQDR
jgi:hypothetical protein